MFATLDAPAPQSARQWPGPWTRLFRRLSSIGFRWLPLAYAAVLILTRLLTSQSLEHDEAEQVLFAQRLEWGYSLQPPLYTWITWLTVQILGLNLLALAAVKTALVLALFTMLARLLRRAGVPRDSAAVAGMTLLFTHFFAWNAALNITHTVLSTTILAATLLHSVNLVARPTVPRYALLGALVALGILAKYNFAVFAAALLLAGLTLPAARRVLLDARMSIAVTTGLLLLTPHLRWLFQHWDGVFAALEAKTGLDDDISGVARIGRGLWTLLEHAVVLLAPLLLAICLCVGRGVTAVWRGPAIRQVIRPDAISFEARLWQRAAVTLGLLMTLVILAGVNRMTVGWLAPGLLLVPLIVFGRLAASGWPLGLNRRLGWAVVAVVLVAATIRVSAYGAWHGRNLGRDLLFAEAARMIERDGLMERPFRADNLVTAGNLRFYCPDLAISSLDMPLFPARPSTGAQEPAGRQVFVWNTSRKVVAAVRDHLAGLGCDETSSLMTARHVLLERGDLHAGFRSLALADQKEP